MVDYRNVVSPQNAGHAGSGARLGDGKFNHGLASEPAYPGAAVRRKSIISISPINAGVGQGVSCNLYNKQGMHSREVNGVSVVECPAAGPPLETEADAVALIQAAVERGARQVVIPATRLSDDFFRLKTGKAGAM